VAASGLVEVVPTLLTTANKFN